MAVREGTPVATSSRCNPLKALRCFSVDSLRNQTPMTQRPVVFIFYSQPKKVENHRPSGPFNGFKYAYFSLVVGTKTELKGE